MRWLIVCLLSLLLGCSQDEKPATALVVSVKSNFAPGTELTEVWFRAFPRDSNPNTDKPFADVRVPVSEMERPFVIEKGSDDQVLIAVQGLGTANPKNAIVEHRLLARFEGGRSLQIPVFLGKDCKDKSCAEPPGQTCYWEPVNGVAPGSCGPIPFPQMSSVLESPEDYGKWVPPSGDGGPMGDANPCAMMSLDGGTCNPMTQCGCGMGTNCQLNDDGDALCSERVGTMPKGANCNDKTVFCAPGLSCTLGACTDYCAKDADCGNGACLKAEGKSFGSCVMRCTDESQCAVNIACTQLRNINIPDGKYCYVPSSDCGAPDKICDEPQGTGLCRAGTDAVDCRPASSCSLTTQTGCPATSACQMNWSTGSTSYTTRCAAFGTVAAGAVCSSSAQCARGLTCWSGICQKYCTTSAECGTGVQCIMLQSSMMNLQPAIGICSIPCNFTTGAPCATGTVCAQWSDGPACYRQPATCPTRWVNDGACDETTRLCAVGTDSDCR